MKEVGDILLGIKGGGQISSMNQPPPRGMVSAEADEVLRPLMDLLDGNFFVILILLLSWLFCIF